MGSGELYIVRKDQVRAFSHQI